MPSVKNYKRDSKNQDEKNHLSAHKKDLNEKLEDKNSDSHMNKSEKRRPGREKQIEVVSVDIAVSEQNLKNDSVASTKKQKSQTKSANSEVENEICSNDNEIKNNGDENLNDSAGSESEFEKNLKDKIENENKVEVNFPGSEILRAKLPKTFEIADKVATDWVHDGRFEELSLKNPLAQYFVAKGLRQAKTLEKKLANSPTTEKIAMNVFTAALKVQNVVSEAKNKVDEIIGKK